MSRTYRRLPIGKRATLKLFVQRFKTPKDARECDVLYWCRKNKTCRRQRRHAVMITKSKQTRRLRRKFKNTKLWPERGDCAEMASGV